MVRILLCLFLLIITRSSYAWYCTYTPTQEGFISNLQCYDIDPTLAIQNYWCPYRNQDPICRQFDQPVIPACSDRIEVQSIACQPNHSGVINQSRNYYCQTDTYSDWVTTSNNCTPNPPTCFESTEERQVACQDGYTGSITQQRQSTCQDPYSQSTFGAWVETQNSCVQSLTNLQNVTSPISPVSPINPVNASPTQEIVTTAPVETPMELQSSQIVTEKSSENTSNSSKTNTVAPQSNNDTQPISTPKASENNSSVSVPKGRDLVPGFGIVLSFEILNSPITFQQQQLEIALDYSQEIPDGIRGNQDFLLELINNSGSNNIFDIGSKRWGDLRRHNDLQPCYSCD